MGLQRPTAATDVSHSPGRLRRLRPVSDNFQTIVVGTDGSGTATEAVRRATDLAASVGGRLELVSAYEPVSGVRLRQEAQQAPGDVQWMVNPREDVDATLQKTAEEIRAKGVEVTIWARQGDPADAIL